LLIAVFFRDFNAFTLCLLVFTIHDKNSTVRAVFDRKRENEIFSQKKLQKMTHLIHIGDVIRGKLAERGQSITWLALQVHHDRSSLCKLLKKPSIDTKLLLDISKVMKIDFFSCYSNLL
jgi:hypothetical protein